MGQIELKFGAVCSVFLFLVGCYSVSLPVGHYIPSEGLVVEGNVRTGTYYSVLGDLPVQNPVRFDIGFGDLIPWQNNSPSQGVEFLVLNNELIRANHDGVVKFIRSDRIWRRTHIDIDNGVIDGKRYMSAFEYVGDIGLIPGDEITKGQVIGQGYVGRGSVYFEIRIDGKPVDPIKQAK
ncbi:MAG: M23 family metallopeptidase [Candidatus Micrarchaeota archaeon]